MEWGGGVVVGDDGGGRQHSGELRGCCRISLGWEGLRGAAAGGLRRLLAPCGAAVRGCRGGHGAVWGGSPHPNSAPPPSQAGVRVAEGVDITRTNVEFLQEQFNRIALHVLRCTGGGTGGGGLWGSCGAGAVARLTWILWGTWV